MEEMGSKKRGRVYSDDAGFDSPEVKRIREDLLEILDEGEFYTASVELDSFMRSFEEEICSRKTAGSEASTVVDPKSGSGESQPELDFLLEASDDELGLPPSTGDVGKGGGEKTELVRVTGDSSELISGDLWIFESVFPSFELFNFGDFDDASCNDDYVALDGLFDYLDLGIGFSDLTRRPETLPAK